MTPPDDRDNLQQMLQEIRDHRELRDVPQWELSRLTGEFGEAAVAQLRVNVDGDHLLEQHTPGARAQGLDLEFYRDDGVIETAEVKASLADTLSGPRMSTLADGTVQSSDAWNANASTQAQAAFSETDLHEGRVESSVYQVDAHVDGDAIARFDVDSQGKVDSDPSETWSLSDVLAVESVREEAADAEPDRLDSDDTSATDVDVAGPEAGPEAAEPDAAGATDGWDTQGTNVAELDGDTETEVADSETAEAKTDDAESATTEASDGWDTDTSDAESDTTESDITEAADGWDTDSARLDADGDSGSDTDGDSGSDTDGGW